MSSVLISREDARERGLKRYFTGTPCIHGHVVERTVSSGQCLECNRILQLKRPKKEKLSALHKWRKANPEYYREVVYTREEERRRLAEKHRNTPREVLSEQVRKWRENNPEKNAETARRSNALRRGKTPPWADREAIRKIYAECRRITKETGVVHHVDHIIPLRGANISGLHVAENLQILTALENLQKYNKTPEMLQEAA